LPYALWAYRTSERIAIVAMPYSLMFRDEVAIPLKIEIPSLRIALKDIMKEPQHFLFLLRGKCINKKKGSFERTSTVNNLAKLKVTLKSDLLHSSTREKGFNLLACKTSRYKLITIQEPKFKKLA